MIIETESAAGQRTAPLCELKIVLLGSKPPIWRRLQVPGDATLAWLHAVIQVAMGWTNSHLHHFLPKATREGREGTDQLQLIALTATAGQQVEQDMLGILKLRGGDNGHVVRETVADRPKFSYQIVAVKPGSTKTKAYHEILTRHLPKALRQRSLADLLRLVNQRREKSLGIVFCIYADPHGKHSIYRLSEQAECARPKSLAANRQLQSRFAGTVSGPRHDKHQARRTRVHVQRTQGNSHERTGRACCRHYRTKDAVAFSGCVCCRAQYLIAGDFGAIEPDDREASASASRWRKVQMKVVFDTSVLVAAAHSKSGARHALVSSIPSPEFQLCLSVSLYVEWQQVLTRAENLSPGRTAQDALNYLRYLAGQSHLQKIHFLWRPFLRDATDDMVLELAFAAGCRHLVTHNVKDFHGAEQLGVTVISPREFLKLTRQQT